jgi:hypothetical protein
MKLLAALVIISLIAISFLADFLWRRWLARMSAARGQDPHNDQHNGPRA